MKKLLCGFGVACGLLGFALAAHSQSYTFSTLAGAAGLGGWADGTNSAARFQQPAGIAVDPAGNVYIADTLNNAIRKLSPVGENWVVTTLAGATNGAVGWADGTNEAARFYLPCGIAVDTATNLYVADTYNDTIRKLTQDGTNWVVTTLAGSHGLSGTNDGPVASARFNWPRALAVDPAGNVFVADYNNHSLRRISSDGSVSTLAGFPGHSGSLDGTNLSARFYYPAGLALDAAGNLYVADSYNLTIRKVSPIGPDWVVTTIAGSPGVADSADGTNSAALFTYPFGVAVDPATNVFVADTYANTIREVTPSGTNWVVTTLAGLPGQPGYSDGIGAAALFYQPYALAVDNAGNLYVADTGNQTIRLGRPGFLLQALHLGNQLILSWPAAASNYLLQTSTSLAPGASWSPVTDGVVLQGGCFLKSNTLDAGPAFFRLYRP